MKTSIFVFQSFSEILFVNTSVAIKVIINSMISLVAKVFLTTSANEVLVGITMVVRKNHFVFDGLLGGTAIVIGLFVVLIFA